MYKRLISLPPCPWCGYKDMGKRHVTLGFPFTATCNCVYGGDSNGKIYVQVAFSSLYAETNTSNRSC